MVGTEENMKTEERMAKQCQQAEATAEAHRFKS